MITYVSGDLFKSPAHVLVNTVNTVGVMGKGVALEFKRLFPDMFAQYRNLCEKREFDIGNLLLFKTPNKWVLNFPTKKHWRQPSRPEYIEAGLKKLTSIYAEAGIHNLAMPLLGCGNGELNWQTEVKPLVEKYLKRLPMDVFVHFYAPGKVLAEHRTIKDMEKWLRSEPEHLPFEEVWKDLIRTLKDKSRFHTLTESSEFRAFVSSDPRGIAIERAGGKTVVEVPALGDFWRQLRMYGFTSRQIAPSGLSRTSSYLIPIFAELEYVKPTRMSDSYEQLRSGLRETIGLQYLPRLHEGPGPLFDTSERI